MAPRMRSRSLTAGSCGTTWPGTPRRRSWRTAAASKNKPQRPATPAAGHPRQRRRGQNPPRRRLSRTGSVMCAAGSGAWWLGPANATPPSTSSSPPGTPSARPACALGLDLGTVQRFAREPDVASLLIKATSRESRLDPFKPWINQRWNEGITDATVLHAELQPRGWDGTVQAVRRYVRPFRAQAAAPPPARPCPKPARSPAGCLPAATASTPQSRPSSPASARAAPTWTPWPPT